MFFCRRRKYTPSPIPAAISASPPIHNVGAGVVASAGVGVGLEGSNVALGVSGEVGLGLGVIDAVGVIVAGGVAISSSFWLGRMIDDWFSPFQFIRSLTDIP